MARVLFKKENNPVEVHIHSITTDARYIEVSSKDTENAAVWVEMKEFVKVYNLIGTIKEFNESDINNMKSDEKF